MITTLPRRSSLALAILSTMPSLALASSFQLLEQSPSHLGNAFAGTASNIMDATSVYFNPAGISQLEGRHITLGANLVFTESKFRDRASNTNGIESRTDETGVIPNAYYVHPVNDRLTLGLGLNGPFGLASDYGRDWMGRYLATYSDLEIASFNTTFAYELAENFALGLGVSYQRAEVILESQVDSTFGVNPNPATDSSAKIEGSDHAFVADVSAFFSPTESTSLGLVWRQGAKFELEGDARFALNAACTPGAGYPTGTPPAPTTGTICAATLTALDGDAAADIELPDTLTFSFTQQLNSRWALHGDIAWTQWSSIDTIDIVNTENGITVSQLHLQYDDTMRYALGVTFKPGNAWTWRAGIAIDEAPQKDPAIANPRIPDQDRTWLSLGFNYAISQDVSVDVGYAHLFVDDASIANIDSQTGHRVFGDYDAQVDIVGVQANWKF